MRRDDRGQRPVDYALAVALLEREPVAALHAEGLDLAGYCFVALLAVGELAEVGDVHLELFAGDGHDSLHYVVGGILAGRVRGESRGLDAAAFDLSWPIRVKSEVSPEHDLLLGGSVERPLGHAERSAQILAEGPHGGLQPGPYAERGVSVRSGQQQAELIPA